MNSTEDRKTALGGVLGTEEDAYWRERHSGQPFARSRTFDDFQGAYRTGYEGYNKYGMGGRNFDACDTELRQDYERNKGKSAVAWEDARHAARAAWERVSNRSGKSRYERLIDHDVQDQTGKKIGTLSNLWTDESDQPAFLGVKTGWIFGKNHVVPVHTAQVNDRQKIIRVPFSEDKIKEAPAFDADCDLSDEDADKIYRYYGTQRPQFQRTGSTAAAGTVGTTATAGAAANRGTVPTRAEGEQGATMKLSEEQLKIGKREVEAGGVRLRKIVRTETVN